MNEYSATVYVTIKINKEFYNESAVDDYIQEKIDFLNRTDFDEHIITKTIIKAEN